MWTCDANITPALAKKKNSYIYIDFCVFPPFSTQFEVASSHQLANSLPSDESLQPGGGVNMCFLQDKWSHPTTSFCHLPSLLLRQRHRVAEHTLRKALSALFCWQTCEWLVLLWQTGEWDYTIHRSHFLSCTPGHGWLWHCQDLNSRSPGNRMNASVTQLGSLLANISNIC